MIIIEVWTWIRENTLLYIEIDILLDGFFCLGPYQPLRNMTFYVLHKTQAGIYEVPQIQKPVHTTHFINN